MACLGGSEAGEKAWKSHLREESVPRDSFCSTGVQLLVTPAFCLVGPTGKALIGTGP